MNNYLSRLGLERIMFMIYQQRIIDLVRVISRQFYGNKVRNERKT